jgi:uncharacterized membrane protein
MPGGGRARRRLMALGPVELLVVRFPGNEFRGEIAPALRELVEGGTIRIIDLLFVTKDAEGAVASTELTDLDEDTYAVYDPLVSDLEGLLADDDVQRLGAALEPNSSAAVMLFENAWATRFRDAVVNARGELVLAERIPRSVIEEVAAARVQAAQTEEVRG